MEITIAQLTNVLSQFNPWWHHKPIAGLPECRRTVFGLLHQWVTQPPAPRAVLLAGARQVGKTTLMLQLIEDMIDNKISPANILYATFDHPILKLAGVDSVLQAWRECIPKTEGQEYLFLDEFQLISDWGTWIKHQTDFQKDRRITFSGSATTLRTSQQESGVGRWHTIHLPTLSFKEYLAIKNVSLPPLPPIQSLPELLKWTQSDFRHTTEIAEPYIGHFHKYLVRGGFPQITHIESIQETQKLLREDIIDKVLKRDMTALFGVRNILDLERIFLYLCMHDGGLLNMAELCDGLSVKRATAQRFIELLRATHLIYYLLPYGYGKNILRARFKIYLSDSAIAPAVMLKDETMLTDPIALSMAAEATVFKHLHTNGNTQHARFSYWRGKKDHEVDLVVEVAEQIIPFEVKYREQHTGARSVKGLFELCRQHSIDWACVVTKSLDDFGVMQPANTRTDILHIPAVLLCYYMDEAGITTALN